MPLPPAKHRLSVQKKQEIQTLQGSLLKTMSKSDMVYNPYISYKSQTSFDTTP